MSETTLQFIVASKIVWLALFSLLYGLGGIFGKWKRRYIGSAWMMAGIVLYSLIQGVFSYWYLLYLPLLIGALSLGYGADELSEKIKKRAIYGLALSFAPISLFIFNDAWVLWGFHTVICILASVILGVFNPTKSARHEETLIAALSGIGPLFSI